MSRLAVSNFLNKYLPITQTCEGNAGVCSYLMGNGALGMEHAVCQNSRRDSGGDVRGEKRKEEEKVIH